MFVKVKSKLMPWSKVRPKKSELRLSFTLGFISWHFAHALD